ncbi:MAG: aspartate carbamoyltransferase regulatory subunit [Bacteroidales bacterium]|nr:aspartate carbamoyltransferase regulatory subunit [Bacteroidales bacterium]MBR4497047.1 aspartate carbamoyltransferase regulatory subunit [Bacteroidales bacterium]MBR4690645.1 aspartate carbamoyltransferase regulatory subunit [Bacteroidales bacterium]MBR7034217.1 aspartate carbamoyltransferase regulatory subunit [Bacteroidales bacterium]
MGNIQGKQMVVSAIQNGTVIDHIPSKNLFKVISILKLENIDTQITFGLNLESKKLGSKAIIKIADKFFMQDEINKIAILAPEAKLSIIKDYQVVEKKVLTCPDQVQGITRCFNPKCVTNHQNITPKFTVIEKSPNVSLRCEYCEKITDFEHFKFI